MSAWTHVAGVIRFDALRLAGERRPNLGKTVNGYERDRKKWAACNVPCGTEGSIQHSTVVDPHRNRAAAYVCTFWGDLRDYENIDEIVAYFQKITRGRMVRQMAVEIDTGAKVVLLRMENDHLLVIGHEVHASLLEQLPLAARLEEADWWHKNGDWSKAPYKKFAEHCIAGLERALQESRGQTPFGPTKMKQLPLIPEYTVCIDWAIGPKMRVAGIKCPCPKCSPGGSEESR